MKKKIKLTVYLIKIVVVIIISAKSTLAQNKYSFTNRLNIRISGGIAAQNGVDYDHLLSNGKSGPYGTLFLGYRFDDNTNTANYVGLFGTTLKISGTSIQQMGIDKALVVPSNFNGGSANAFELEGGLIFGDWFRLSAGVGSMQLPTVGAWQKKNYYTGTGGFIFGKKLINFHATTTVLFGGDLTKSAFRVNAGFGFSFKFLKSRKKYS